MSKHRKHSTRPLSIALLIAAFAAVTATPAYATDFEAPRLKGTDLPDFNGIWQALNTANYDIERHLARPAMALRDGPRGPIPASEVLALGAVGAVPAGLGVVRGGKPIPYKPEALEARNENARQWLDRDPEIKCFLPGVPRATYMPYPFQIIQNDHGFFIAYEYAGAVRDFLFEDPGPAPVDSWMGQSVARWDGDTLVVTVTGLHPDSWFDRSGNHHSAQMTVTERYTMTSPNHILYEATIDDPETFTAPWTIRMPLYRRMEPDGVLMDFKCVEFVEELMYGKWRRNPLEPPEP